MIQAAFALAFAGFLRVGEFTYGHTDREIGPAFSPWFLTKSCVRLIERKTVRTSNERPYEPYLAPVSRFPSPFEK